MFTSYIICSTILIWYQKPVDYLFKFLKKIIIKVERCWLHHYYIYDTLSQHIIGSSNHTSHTAKKVFSFHSLNKYCFPFDVYIFLSLMKWRKRTLRKYKLQNLTLACIYVKTKLNLRKKVYTKSKLSSKRQSICLKIFLTLRAFKFKKVHVWRPSKLRKAKFLDLSSNKFYDAQKKIYF